MRTPIEFDGLLLTVRSDFRNTIRVVTKFDHARPKHGIEPFDLLVDIAAVTCNKSELNEFSNRL